MFDMLNKTLFPALVLSTILSCGPQTYVDRYTYPREVSCETLNTSVFIDSEFNDPELSNILYAINEWKFATNCGFNPEVEIKPVEPREPQSIALVGKAYMKENFGDSVIGYFSGNPNTGWILIRNDTNTTWVAMHELGHRLGSGHIAGTIMNKSYEGQTSTCIHQPVIDAVCETINCGDAYLSTCVEEIELNIPWASNVEFRTVCGLTHISEIK